MSREKQIEEMCVIAKQALDENRDWRCKCDICCANIIDGIYCDESAVINGLYNAGYRKQREGKWKFHKDGSGTCDQCGTTQKNVWDYDNWQNYCGHCGARMKGAVSK